LRRSSIVASSGTVVIVVVGLIALGSQGDQGCDKPAPAPADQPGEAPPDDPTADPDDDFSFEPEPGAPPGG
jgi:hypothetical protein